MAAIIEENAPNGLREVGVIGFVTLAVFVFIALLTFSYEDPGWTHSGSGVAIHNACGVVGAWVADFSLSILGVTAFFFPFMIAWQGCQFVLRREGRTTHWELAFRWLGFVVSGLTISVLAYLHVIRLDFFLPNGAGGILGEELGELLTVVLGRSGVTLFLLTLLLSGVTLLTHLSWLTVVDGVGKYTLLIVRFLRQKNNLILARFSVLIRSYMQRFNKVSVKSPENTPLHVFEVSDPLQATKKTRVDPLVGSELMDKVEPVMTLIEPSSEEILLDPPMSFDSPSKKEVVRKRTKKLPVADKGLPELSLLDQYFNTTTGYSSGVLQDMSRLVENILTDFNVDVDVVAVNPGPVVTRFELQLAPGIKVSRISGLAKDLARALSVTSVRIVEIIPGKTVIGLEIPNKEREMVSLREILSSAVYKQSESALTLALGKDISGAPVIADLVKMPHLLVAGTTGSGKSVAINTMILSLLYKSTPADVRMIMIDPKMLELSVYEGIPHLLTPVVTDMKDASNALRWSVAEMERRYRLMSLLGVRNLDGFNRLVKEAQERGEPIKDPLFKPETSVEQEHPVLETLPNIVIVIDELADMMMIVGKKVEELIARLAQKARASGLHLILATQRPSVDVLTGLIKANVPSRIAFQVSSKIDSRTIIDQGGAESLLGNGDMLFMPSGTSLPIRAHGAFVNDHEVHQIVSYLKQTGPADYLDLVVSDSSGQSVVGFTEVGSEEDPIYDQAVNFVTETRKASISSVQRRFKVGYNRAARLIEDMEAAGVVTSPESNGSRQVIAPPPTSF